MSDNEQCFDELMVDSIKYGVFDDIDNTIEMLMKLKKKLNSFDCKNSILIYSEFQTEIWIIEDIIKKINHVLNVICKEEDHIDEDNNKTKQNKNKKVVKND